jgi:hypothetical protein
LDIDDDKAAVRQQYGAAASPGQAAKPEQDPPAVKL